MAHAATLSALTDDLITAITLPFPLHKHSRHFKLIKESSLKTFKTLQHVRVNQFEIDARLQGLLEKFIVLNNEALADVLKPRLDELAARPLKWKPEILALLLALSDRPVDKTNIHKALEIVPEDAVEPQLTWADIIADDPLNEEGVWDHVDVDESDYSEHCPSSPSHLSVNHPTTASQPSSIADNDAANFARASIIPKDSRTLHHLRSLRHHVANMQSATLLSELQVVQQTCSSSTRKPTEYE
jgi:gamma-tubulin complex component 5